jgi:hypothetical protein
MSHMSHSVLHPNPHVRTVRVNARTEVVLVGLCPVACGCGCLESGPERHMVPYRGQKVLPACFLRGTTATRKAFNPWRSRPLADRAQQYLERTAS